MMKQGGGLFSLLKTMTFFLNLSLAVHCNTTQSVQFWVT